MSVGLMVAVTGVEVHSSPWKGAVRLALHVLYFSKEIIMPLWLLIVIGVVGGLACYIIGYFCGRHDERSWNLFLYQYGHFYGVRQERRRHR